MVTNKSETKVNSKNPNPQQKTTANVPVPIKKLTQAQSARLKELLANTPTIEKLDPGVYAKLQSTIHETIEKTLPQYKQWLNAQLGEQIVADACPTPICDCNTCPTPVCDCNTCPTPVCDCTKCPTPIDQLIDEVANTAISKAMSAAITYTLGKAQSKDAGTTVSEAQMKSMMKEQLIKAAEEIGK